MQDFASFLETNNAGKIPKVYETSTGRIQMTVLNSMNLPKIFGIYGKKAEQKLKLDTVADLDPLWIWVGHPEEAPNEVIYLVGPMSKMKEKVLK